MTKGEIAYTEINSPLGARTHFELPDGSSGWLNSGSKLKFPSYFFGSTRDVFLTGEGFFDVNHMSKKPFVVKTNWSEVIALGTSFNVMAWPDEEQITVTMESGQTLINRIDENKRKSKITDLRYGEQIIFYKHSSEVQKHRVAAEYFTSWKDGKLIFKNESMIEILKKLGRWYNVDFIIEDKVIEEYEYRASFRDETLEEVLRMLEKTSPIGYQEMEREVLPDGVFSKKKIKLFIRPELTEKYKDLK
jgi:ferric-dicitrate binding protein FerR (iron transport regulator)